MAPGVRGDGWLDLEETMRHGDGLPPTFESLESRRLMSTSVFLNLDCLPPAAPPTPTPTPGADPGPNDAGPEPTRAHDPMEAVIPQVTGGWSGSQVKTDQSLGAELSLVVYSPAPGELKARLDFHGPRRIRWTGQLMYNETTGRLTMFYLSGTLVAKLDVALVTDGDTTSLEGTIGYSTPDAGYTATVGLHRAGAA
jgi:hypothetical protein